MYLITCLPFVRGCDYDWLCHQIIYRHVGFVDFAASEAISHHVGNGILCHQI